MQVGWVVTACHNTVCMISAWRYAGTCHAPALLAGPRVAEEMDAQPAHRYQQTLELAVGLGARSVASLEPRLNAAAIVCVSSLHQHDRVPHDLVGDGVLEIVRHF